MDLVSDFSAATVEKLNELKKKHNFIIFEDRKLIDIGHTVQRQYHGGSLRLSEFADVVNISPLSGNGILEALAQTLTGPDFPYANERALLVLAEMTTQGSMAVGPYTNKCIDLARKYPEVVIGFVATRALTHDLPRRAAEDEDFITFTTGVSMSTTADSLGQQYQTPSAAIARGSDFIIAGRGIYAAPDPVEAAKAYQKSGWEAYLRRDSAQRMAALGQMWHRSEEEGMTGTGMMAHVEERHQRLKGEIDDLLLEIKSSSLGQPRP